MRIAIVGSTGVGKSTTAKYLQERLNGYILSLEPVPSSLQRFLDAQGSDVEYYERLRHDYNIINAHYRLLPERTSDKVVIERPAAENVYCFGLEQDKSLFFKAYMELAEKLPVDVVIYLKALPDVITERINRRNRPGEGFYSRDWVKKHCQVYEDSYRLIANAHSCKRIEVIECSIKTPDQVVGEIINKLDLRKYDKLQTGDSEGRILY